MWFPMKGCALLVLVFFGAGCAAVPALEHRCFESLTAEYLAAQDEWLARDAAWRTASQRLATSANGIGQAEHQAAWQQLQEARARLAPVMLWYDRLYERLRVRAEEEEILSETRLLLFAGPTALFYPLVRWNLHQVLWDGTDPDAASDPITRYCTERLAADSARIEVGARVSPDSSRSASLDLALRER
jgi:hypothetical protein